MPVHFLAGKMGGGKTLYAVRLIASELGQTQRTVITNVGLCLPELIEFVARETKRDPTEFVGRVIILSDEETATFWCFRPGGVRIPTVSKEEWEAGKKPSYAEVKDDGVLYVIDEVQNFWNARTWQLTGQNLTFYLTQHRKLGDDIIAIAPGVGLVDKQFRSLAQDFTYLRNLSKERFGRLRFPALFIRRTFASVPGPHTPAMESSTFKLDAEGLAACYETAKGVGIHGRLADTGAKLGGLHWGWGLAGLAVVFVVLFMFLPKVIARGFSSVGFQPGPVVTTPVKGVARVSAGPVGEKSIGLGVGGGVLRSGSAPALALRGVYPDTNQVREVFMTGLAYLGPGHLAVCLSDGRVLYAPEDRRLESVGKEGCVVEGKRYRRRPSIP